MNLINEQTNIFIMVTSKPTLFYLILFILFSSYARSQTSILVDPSVLPEVVAYIEETYGEQIEINMDEVYDFLSAAINDGNYSEECDYSTVDISENEFDYLAFSWEAPLEGVEYFEHRSLNLYTGNSTYTSTDEGEAIYSISSGFYLFLFNSICSSRQSSAAQIIIVDKDVMLNGPPALRNCICNTPSIVNLPIHSGPPLLPNSNNTTNLILGNAQLPWSPNPNCTLNKYIINIDDPNNNYEASAFILHDPLHTPALVYLHPTCSQNLYIPSSTNLNAGDPGKYFLEFTSSNIMVNVQDLSIVQNGKIDVSICKCDVSGRTDQTSLDQGINNFAVSYLNPISDQMSLKIELPDAAEISFQFWDMLGQSIGLDRSENRAAGSNLFEFSTMHLSPGIYNGLIKCGNQSEVIKIIKVQ